MNTTYLDDLDLAGRGVPVERRADAGMRVRHRIGGVVREVALPVTFTPFASVKPCSARCRFCSETLVHREATRLSQTLRPGPGYLDGLEAALRELRGLPIGVSLSGLEATDDADWLEAVLDRLDAHAAHPDGLVTGRVLYSNGSGLARETTGARLIPRLAGFGLDRIELSRHAIAQEAIDAIMRFRPGRPIARREVFERTARDVAAALPVKLVCVVQAGGVTDLAEVEAYLAWARDVLGVGEVVFRELSRLGDLYRPNAALRYVERARVPIEGILREAWAPGGDPAEGFVPAAAVRGYYYWNVRFRWHDAVDVTFETSDYTTMKERHASGVVHKLIFHADGSLCGDWDPGTEVLLRTGARVSAAEAALPGGAVTLGRGTRRSHPTRRPGRALAVA